MNIVKIISDLKEFQTNLDYKPECVRPPPEQYDGLVKYVQDTFRTEEMSCSHRVYKSELNPAYFGTMLDFWRLTDTYSYDVFGVPENADASSAKQVEFVGDGHLVLFEVFKTFTDKYKKGKCMLRVVFHDSSVLVAFINGKLYCFVTSKREWFSDKDVMFVEYLEFTKSDRSSDSQSST